MNSSFAQIQDGRFISEGIKSIAGVDFVGLISGNGKIENYTPDTEILPSKQKKEMFCMGIALRHKMQNDFDDDFEPVKYNVTERGNFKFVTIPILSKILFVRMKRDFDHLELINKITPFFTNYLKAREYINRDEA